MKESPTCRTHLTKAQTNWPSMSIAPFSNGPTMFSIPNYIVYIIGCLTLVCPPILKTILDYLKLNVITKRMIRLINQNWSYVIK